ncbi:ribonuclease H-like domain-containing protein [Tanacetum coccineum]
MFNCNPCRTLVDTEKKLGPEGSPVTDPILYRSLAGALQYLTFTLPDLSYTVQQLCLYMHDPREPHLNAMKRVLCYLMSGLFSARSTFGYWFFLGDYLNDRAETSWIRNLLRELHNPLFTATLVYCDNGSAVYMSANPVQHQRTKHIEIDIHFVRDKVAACHVRVLHGSRGLSPLAESRGSALAGSRAAPLAGVPLPGFKQKKWIDYFDTYAPVVRITTIRLLLALAAIHNLVIHQMDVKIIFLNGDLDEVVYMKQPDRFVMPSNEHKFSMKDMGEADVILGTMNYGLSYMGYPSVLEGYSDASWINHVEDSSSTSEGVPSWGVAFYGLQEVKHAHWFYYGNPNFVAMDAACKEAEMARKFIHEISIMAKTIHNIIRLIVLPQWLRLIVKYIMGSLDT